MQKEALMKELQVVYATPITISERFKKRVVVVGIEPGTSHTIACLFPYPATTSLCW